MVYTSDAFGRSLYESSPDCVKIIDADGRLLQMNANGLCALEIDDFALLEGSPWCDMWPLDARNEVTAALASASAGFVARFQLQCPTIKGTEKWWDVMVAPIRDPDGTVVRFVSVSRDITDLKRAEQNQREMATQLQQQAAKLSAADRRKDEFLATLAHELRNPLAPIRNCLQIMRLAPDNATSVQLAVAVMDRQLSQMVRLVDDLLDLSRINSDKLELRRERVALTTVIYSAIETSQSLINDNGLQLTVAIPATPIMLNADLTRLAQAFLNLLNNAAKFSNRGGAISLTAERQNDHVLVTVADNGVGIEAAHLPGIFEMFAQVNPSLGQSQGGLGIGLTLVRRLVELHDGQVEAHSGGPGCGSTFSVRLPIASAIEPLAVNTSAHARASASHYRILVVDDNHDSATSLAMMLKLMGHDTHAVYDGATAITAAASFLPDVSLLDIGLPGINGYEVARHIRLQPWGKSMVLLALTGWGQDDDRRRSQHAGFDHHLVKPIDPQELTKLLDAGLGLGLGLREGQSSD